MCSLAHSRERTGIAPLIELVNSRSRVHVFHPSTSLQFPFIARGPNREPQPVILT